MYKPNGVLHSNFQMVCLFSILLSSVVLSCYLHYCIISLAAVTVYSVLKHVTAQTTPCDSHVTPRTGTNNVIGDGSSHSHRTMTSCSCCSSITYRTVHSRGQH